MATRSLLIIGGGFAGLEATLAVRALATDRVSVVVVAPEEDFVYRPLAVAALFRAADVRSLALRGVVAAAGGRLVPGFVASLDTERALARTADGLTLPFDVVLVAAGATDHEAVPGALTFRGLQDEDAFAGFSDPFRKGPSGSSSSRSAGPAGCSRSTSSRS